MRTMTTRREENTSNLRSNFSSLCHVKLSTLNIKWCSTDISLLLNLIQWQESSSTVCDFLFQIFFARVAHEQLQFFSSPVLHFHLNDFSSLTCKIFMSYLNGWALREEKREESLVNINDAILLKDEDNFFPSHTNSSEFVTFSSSVA